jgi:multidrug efflux pump subunit AcrB
MQVIDAAMARCRTVILGLVSVLIAGIITYVTIPKEAEPDIEIPIIYVYIEHVGISPEDAERLLVRPMEQEIRSIEGIKEMIAEAFEGGASVQIEFEAGIDTDKALQDVREKVDMAEAKLPGESEEPTVNEVKMTRFDPMLVLNLAGNVPERTLTTIAKDLKEDLEAIGGVLEVRVTDSTRRRSSVSSRATTSSLLPARYSRVRAASLSRYPACLKAPPTYWIYQSRPMANGLCTSRTSPKSAARTRMPKVTRA